MEEVIQKIKKIPKCCTSCKDIKNEIKATIKEIEELKEKMWKLRIEQGQRDVKVDTIYSLRKTMEDGLSNLEHNVLENANLRMRIRRLEDQINKLSPIDSSPNIIDAKPNIKVDAESIKIRLDKFIEEGTFLRGSLLTHCWQCGIKIEDYSLFTHHEIKNAEVNKSNYSYEFPAVGTVEVEYYICKNGCYK